MLRPDCTSMKTPEFLSMASSILHLRSKDSPTNASLIGSGCTGLQALLDTRSQQDLKSEAVASVFR